MTESRALTRSHLLIVDVPRDVPTFLAGLDGRFAPKAAVHPGSYLYG
jgi:hypothetical protein